MLVRGLFNGGCLGVQFRQLCLLMLNDIGKNAG